MWIVALAAMSVVVPTQAAAKLEISDIRTAFSSLGPLRELPNNPVILPGDHLHYQFDIGGLKPDSDGRIRFATILEIIGQKDGKDVVLFKQNVGEVFQVGILDAKFRHCVNLTTGLEQAPGPYRVVVTIEDLIGKGVGTFERSFTVAPMRFGLVSTQFCYDRLRLAPAPGVGVVGQTLYVHAVAVGLKPDGNGAAGVTVEMTVTDEKGKQITAKPWTGEFKNLPGETVAWPFYFELPVQKPGVYQIKIQATDQGTKNVVSVVTRYTVVDQK